MSTTLKVGVIGVGHLGRLHALKYRTLPDCRLVGVWDTEAATTQSVAAECDAPAAPSLPALIENADALSIAATTSAHHALGMQCLRAGKHVLIEKPLASTIAQGEALRRAACRAGVILQVGYLERFNPALRACQPWMEAPRFIEALRLTPFRGRGVDMDVVLDLMSHDLDLVSAFVQAPLKRLHAVGTSLYTERTDLANARLEFHDGCVANLTASRISTKNERRIHIFQAAHYFSIDLAQPALKIYEIARRKAPLRIRTHEPVLTSEDALSAQLRSFIRAVREGGQPLVGPEEGLSAMRLARRITRAIQKTQAPQQA